MRSRLSGTWILLCVLFVISNGADVTIAADEKPLTASAPFDEVSQRKAIEEKLKSFFEYRNSISDRIVKAKDDQEQSKIYLELSDREEEVCRELVDIAIRNPKTEAAKQALIWVVNKPGRGIGGNFGGEFDRAAGLLV